MNKPAGKEELRRGLIVFLTPAFLLTTGVVVLCFYWMDDLSMSPIIKTLITVALILLTIFSFTFLVHKIYQLKNKNEPAGK